MKLLMHSFDFEECTLTFSVPKEIVNSRGFGNVPGGVEVDLAAITKDASLGIVVAQNSTSNNSQMDAIALLEEYGTICNFIISNSTLYKKFRDKWLEKVRDYNEKLNH